MSNLVPESRADKNGRIVIRHVRAGTAPTGTSSSGVPPVRQSIEERRLRRRESRVSRIGKTLLLMNYDSDPDPSWEETVSLIRQYSDETIAMLDAALKQDKNQAHVIDNIVNDHQEWIVREMVEFMPDFHEDSEDTEREALLKGLRSYGMFAGEDDLTKLDPERRKAAGLLINAGYHILAYTEACNDIRSGVSNWHIADQNMVDLILGNADRAEDITSFIRERRTADSGAMEDYLSKANALREGSL